MEFTTDKRSVASFLEEFKSLVVRSGKVYVPDRRENERALTKLAINAEIRKQVVLELSVEDYSSGPEPDKDRPGHIWVFGKRVGDTEVYIKLKIADLGDGEIAKCISFHEAMTRISYPFR